MNELQIIETNLDSLAKIKITDKESFGKYLFFASRLEKWAKKIKDRVKIQGSQLMDDLGEDKLDYENFTIAKTAGIESDDYDPKTVYEIYYPKLGDVVWTLLSVNNSKLKELLPSQIQFGMISAEESALLDKTIRKKRRKGSIQLREKKELKSLIG